MAMMRPEIVVVGGGIIGASIAWHLVSAGARVTVVDRGPGGGEATADSFGWINASWGNPEVYFQLRTRSMAEWRRLADALPGLQLSWDGGLCWDLPRPELEEYAREHASWGYDIQPVSRSGVAELEPSLADPPDFALRAAAEGAVEPLAAAKALLADAERRGAQLRTNTSVTSLVTNGSAVTGVDTDTGVVAADQVVIAAGAATSALAASVGCVVPLTTPPGLLVHSRPYPKLLNGLVIAPRLHMRQSADGCIIAGSDFGGADPGLDPEATARKLFAAAKEMLLDAEGLELTSTRSGIGQCRRTASPSWVAWRGGAASTSPSRIPGLPLHRRLEEWSRRSS